jgi:hypothetical protein
VINPGEETVIAGIRTKRRPSRSTSASSGRNDSPWIRADDDHPVELEARADLNLT